MQNIIEDPLSLLEDFFNQDHPDPISELPELGSVEYTDPADHDRYNFLMSERDRLLKIIRSSPITNQEDGACYVACMELDEIHKELDNIMEV